MNELLDLETRGWVALSSGPDAARRFYDAVLAPDVVMLFPGGVRVTGKQAALESMGGPPWASVSIDDARVLELSESTAAVVYRAAASREDGVRYEALISSVYVRSEGAWRLALHQQTPV